jgi:hypothetical protein
MLTNCLTRDVEMIGRHFCNVGWMLDNGIEDVSTNVFATGANSGHSELCKLMEQ